MSELWRVCASFPDYEVSDCGRIRRLTPGKNTQPGLILKHRPDKDGYRKVTLTRESVQRGNFVHRLMWQSFNGPIPAGLQINHKNGVKDDNRLANIELVTPSENTRHGFRSLGRRPVLNPQLGSKNGRAKLSEKDLPEVHRLRAEGWSQQRIADRLGVDQTSISRVLLGQSWKLSR
jgi:hypothetical protein